MAQEETLSRILRIVGSVADAPNGMSYNQFQQLYPTLSPATLSRLLKSMMATGYLRKESGRSGYRLGEKMANLAQLICNPSHLEARLPLVLRNLAQATGQSVAFYKQDGDYMVLHSKDEVSEAYHYRPIGARLHLSETAFGIPILYHISTDAKVSVMSAMNTDHKKELHTAFEEYETDKTFVKNEPTPSTPLGALRVVTAICGDDGYALGAIGLTTFAPPTQDRQIAAWKEMLLSARNQLERAIFPDN